MAQEQGIVVKRAKADDAERIAEFVNHTQGGRTNIGRQAVIARLGNVGFLLAERDGDPVGLLGWQVENLVARVTDMLIWPARERVAAGRALLSEMEDTAQELQCEAVLLFLPRLRPSGLADFYGQFGYEPRELDDLSRVWREAALDAGLSEDDVVLVKQLRSDRVMRPL